MADSVQCFWVDRLPKISRRLRRYARDRDCPIQVPGQCSCCDWIYQRKDTGEEIVFRSLPPGAMFNCHWRGETGPDGIACTVILPDKTPWNIDGCAYGNGMRTPNAWTRTGVPPNISATPSILTPGYHGWLRNGVLVPC